jgi:predicted CoA-binding protein
MSAEPHAPSDGVLRRLLAGRPVIALVGASPRPDRPSHSVMEALLGAGYDVLPVNPGASAVLGQRCFASLGEIPRRVDIVDVFRRPEFAPDLAREAAAIGARALWLQLGVVSEEAAAIARGAGLVVVMDRCLWVEHERLIGMPFTSPLPPPVRDPVGLCRDCRHSRDVPAPRTTYWLCRRSATDPSFPKYPRLPVERCRGFEWSEERNPARE